jgi:short-subunit dehydrogenase
LGLLVLNAGTGWFGDPAQQTGAAIRELIEVNLLAPMRLCHMLIPRLRRARGRIVFISSITALLPCPEFAVYAAAKAAAEGFLRSLRVELEGQVEVQVLRLGAVRTEMHSKCGMNPAEIGWERFPTPEKIAERIDRLLEGPPVWRTLGAGNRALGALGRNLPRIVERMQAKRSRST